MSELNEKQIREIVGKEIEKRVPKIVREEITKWHKDNFVKLPKTVI